MFSITPWRKEQQGGTGVVERDPFRRMRREFDALFDRMWSGWPYGMSEFAPNANWGLDLRDAGKEFFVRAEVPGFDAKDFNVDVSGDLLTITAEHKEEKKAGEEGAGEAWAHYERSVMLPTGIDPDKVEAKYRNGVLEIHLPKTPQAIGRKVEVKT